MGFSGTHFAPSTTPAGQEICDGHTLWLTQTTARAPVRHSGDCGSPFLTTLAHPPTAEKAQRAGGRGSANLYCLGSCPPAQADLASEGIPDVQQATRVSASPRPPGCPEDQTRWPTGSLSIAAVIPGSMVRGWEWGQS